MRPILFSIFLFLSSVSGFAMTCEARAERDVVVTPAPPRTQTARQVEVRSVTIQPAPAVKKLVASPAAVSPVVKKPQVPAAPANARPEHKKETSRPQGSTSFFQGLLDRWFPKR